MNKKKRKIIVWTCIGVVAAAVAGTLLGVFIPPLFNKKDNISELKKNQVVPSEGGGDFLKYSTIEDLPASEKVQSINDFSKRSLINESGINEYISQTISNVLVDFFQNFKDSQSTSNEFNDWIEEINKSFDDTVESYKKQYDDNWQYYFQLEVLDPAGGNPDDYKRNLLFEKVNSKFDELFNKNVFINLVDKTSNNVITNVTEQDLFSDKIFNAVGQPCNIKFIPESNDPASNINYAWADLQSFVFDQYVREKMPIVTSMVLFKHEAPSTNGMSNYFNIKKATNLNGGTDPVGSEASYIWQCFNPEVYNPEGTWNATAKYNNFIKDLNLTAATNSQYSPLIWNSNAPVNLGGAININTAYTDDSATLYLINANDVFSTSFTQYAAASIYKLNNLFFGVTDSNVPTATTFSKNYNNIAGTEIMSNFLNLTSGYSFDLPKTIQDILNDDKTYDFTGRYNGVTKIADTVDITNTPFIMTRDEAGVHIIGIDRYDAIKAAGDFEQKLTEIKNTLLWRDLISRTKTDGGQDASATTGFSIDLSSEIKNYYSANRNELLIKYIISKEKTPPTTEEEKKSYIFSDTYSNMQYPMDPVNKKLINQNEVDLFTKYFDYIDYKKYNQNNSTVKDKIVGLQASYIGKSFGNPSYNDAVITNGIAGILPYSRNVTSASTNLTNAIANTASGVFDNSYGQYDNINWRFSDGTQFLNTTLENKKKLFEDQVNTFLINNFSGDNQLTLKQLTFVTAQYNQWLEIGNKINTSTMFFASSGEKVNHAIFKWIDTSEIKNIVINQKIQQYLALKKSGINDQNNYFISNKQLTNAPGLGLTTTIPTANDATSTSFVNEYLQYAKNLLNLSSAVNSTSYLSYGNWTDFATIYNDFSNANIANVKNGYYTQTQQDLLKSYMALLYAFDYNPTTNSYDFTKYRDYLLNATNNHQKAAFIWSSKDKINYIQDYGTNLQQDFSFKPKMFNVSKNTFGYGYINAINDTNTLIQPVSTAADQPLKFPNTVTFDDRGVYWNYLSPTKDLNTKYTGFLGMQLQGRTTGDLDQEASSLIFGNNAKYLDPSAPGGYKAKGALYNLASNKAEGMKILQEEINRIHNNGQKIGFINWLDNNFPVNNDNPNKAQINNLKNQLLSSVGPASDWAKPLYELCELMIPEYAFERVINDQLANTKNAIQQPNSIKYFGDTRNMASQIIVTQFNHNDVVELFDTDNDKKITDADKGINWSIAAQKGFLGVGADTFFFSAYQWANENSIYSNKAYKDMKKEEGKINVFDKRLNSLFGEEWVENYKKE